MSTAVPFPINVVSSNYYAQQLLKPYGPLPYAEFYVLAGSVENYGIDWAGWIASYWQRGQLVTTAAVIRPSIPNGYQFPCTVAGQTGGAEPLWPTAVGATVLDGSAQWTCQSIDTTSLLSTVQSALWTPPTGVVVSGQTILGQMAFAVMDFTAAVAGTDYVVKSAATLASGQTLVGQLKFKVR